MPAKLELPDAEIVRLKDSRDLSYTEIKEVLNLDCHPDTIARHYHQFKEEYDTVVDEIIEEVKSWWQRFKDWLNRLF